MTSGEPTSALFGTVFVLVASGVGAYFAFSSVQGDYGVFRRIQIEAEIESLKTERDRLTLELEQLQNKNRRLSDDYLDLDLLDEQAREVIGLVRSDEIVLK